MRRLVVIAGLALSASMAANASLDDYDFRPNVKPNLSVPKRIAPIEIDGYLDDEGWEPAARAGNFTEFYPDDGSQPPIHMETWVTYDETQLYLAFLVEDDPELIRSSLRDRDEMWSDDYVGVLLDTYGNANWAYFIFANPFGIQGDARFVSGTGEDDGIDLVYASEGQITDTGYQVEMAIPFSSLRFPDAEVHTWKADFWITHPRQSRSQYSWAIIDRDDACWMCQWGTLTGIEGIKAGKDFEFLPSLVGSQTGNLANTASSSDRFVAGDWGSDLGLGLKYLITPNVVADVALNPDFSQVEADADQIDVNETFALFYPERRPFFQEGGDLFRTYKRVVYSRSINDPSVVAKLTGRFDGLSVAYMGGRDEHTPFILSFEEQGATLSTRLRSTTNIIRAKQSFGEDSYVGFLGTDRRVERGGSGTVLSVDGRLKFRKNYRLEWQLMASQTVEPEDTLLTADKGLDDLRFGSGDHTAAFDGEKFRGEGTYLSVERDAKHYMFDFDYYMRSPTFRADNGFISQNNQHFFSTWQGYTFYPAGKIFDQISPQIWMSRVYNFDGIAKESVVEPSVNLSLKGQTSVYAAVLLMNDERFAGRDFTGMRRVMLNVNSRFSEPVSVGVWVSQGKFLRRDRENPFVGTGREFALWGTLKPTRRFVIEPLYDFQALDDPEGKEVFSGYILRTRINYQFTRELFLRVVLQYNDFSNSFDVDPLLTYRINPFSAFYVGSALDYQNDRERIEATHRTYFFKFQYLFTL